WRVMDMKLACCGYEAGVLRICSWCVVDMQLVCFGYVAGVSWV
ncbi:hypothetical protein chiPu_0029748, partial [Chiloscyllium punctatum]|nr:hypothetical protein [Chiloscyllium punctatum]